MARGQILLKIDSIINYSLRPITKCSVSLIFHLRKNNEDFKKKKKKTQKFPPDLRPPIEKIVKNDPEAAGGRRPEAASSLRLRHFWCFQKVPGGSPPAGGRRSEAGGRLRPPASGRSLVVVIGYTGYRQKMHRRPEAGGRSPEVGGRRPKIIVLEIQYL